MAFAVGQVRFVLDTRDGFPYPCKITKYDEEGGAITIHWVGYGKNKDETLSIESKRILDVAGKSVGEICAQLVGMNGNNIGSRTMNKRSRDDVSSDDESGINKSSKRRPSMLSNEESLQSVPQTASIHGVLPSEAGQGVSHDDGHSAPPTVAAASLSRSSADADNMGRSSGSPSTTTPVVVPQPNGTERGGASGPGSAAQKSCNFCSLEIRSDFISCDRCRGAHHAETICVGISREAIRIILESSNGAIN